MDEPPRAMLRRLKDPLYDAQEPGPMEKVEFYQMPREPYMIRNHNWFVAVLSYLLGFVYARYIGTVGPLTTVAVMVLAGVAMFVLMRSNNDRARNKWINDRD